MSSRVSGAGTAKPMPAWSNAQQARLPKAKSSPNVCKPAGKAHTTLKLEAADAKQRPKSVKAAAAAAAGAAPRTSPRSNNVTLIHASGNANNSDKAAKKGATTKSTKTTPPRGAEPKRKTTPKDSASSPSCTILEDRVLLKKGLPAPSSKLPRKPDEPRNKSLGRSSSLWSVQSPPSGAAPSKCHGSAPRASAPAPARPRQLSRASSLWAVPQARGPPSRIPLPRQQAALGQSLGDLPAADRAGEPVDEVDRSVDEEHIYENCREAPRERHDEQPAVLPLTTLELEKRAEQLLSQLDEDEAVVEASIKHCAEKIHRIACKINADEDDDDGDAAKPPLQKSRAFARSQDGLQSLTSKRLDREGNVSEIRRNWQQQIERCQLVDEAVARRQRLGKSSSSVSLDRGSSKSAKLEHLVNFFNCKNGREPAAKDRWAPSERVAAPEALEAKKSDKSCGYASDGNSSEDSGHISNENEEEVSPLIVQAAKSSSGASSIDSRDNSPKPAKKHIVPQPSQRHSIVQSTQQIFFRAGALERLESQRDEKLTGHIILLQARCRGYLARRKLTTLKLQDLAVRCIQRNVRKFMLVREWPWWRLYVKVAPLLNVHRTEDQLKARTEELEVLRAKVDRLEQERNHLKHDNDRLEAKLSEMTADFAEEHSTSTLAAERIDAEQNERLRLERELQDVNETNKSLQQQAERLEMELLYARAADLNGLASDAEDGEDGGVYKQRYQHAMRELEFTKRKMAQQHEDDLEQLVGLKKQLEKKLADAYEEVEEQRQVVGQWKRRVQKLNGEMHDLRLLLEEQTARNNLLEKKQRKFDSETQNLMDDLRQERAQRERLAREKEIAIAEKFTIEQNLSDARLEIELKEERLHTLTQELEELTFGGKTEEEVAQLKKAKHELEKKLKDQEEELDDLAGQVQLLEQAKLRLEMSIEQQRKEMRKEMQQRDEELEDVRGSAMKKVKALEQQLENEHEERTIVLREKHELERRLVALEEQDRTERAAEAETTQRLKRDLKRTRALLRDAQTMLERSKGDSTGKAALRHLKNQLEDAECARAVAVKAKQALEQDLSETQAALEEASRQRSEAEDRANASNRERSELLSQLEENEEELAEVLKKYRAAVQQVSAEQAHLQEAQVQIAALEVEKASLKDQVAELSQRIESVEQLGDPTANSLATRRLEFRTKELESKLELEQTTRARLETQIARLKETVEKLQSETALLRTKEQTAQDAMRRLQRSLREAREEATSASAREQDATRVRRDLEKALEASEAETKVVKDDLRLALQRIDDLQSAIQGDLDLDNSEEATSDNSDSD